ncbi:MAG: hypothetical protein M3498_01065 [Deinococcota bacterium]|nr:hypothetical protein [Deinococcota bacterium]
MQTSPTVSALIVRVCAGKFGVRLLVQNVRTREQLEFASLESFQAYLKALSERRGLL